MDAPCSLDLSTDGFDSVSEAEAGAVNSWWPVVWTILALLLAWVCFYSRRTTTKRRDATTQTSPTTTTDDTTQTIVKLTLDATIQTPGVLRTHTTAQTHVPITTATTQTAVPITTATTQTAPQQPAPPQAQQPTPLSWLDDPPAPPAPPQLDIAPAPPVQGSAGPPVQGVSHALIPQTHQDRDIPERIKDYIIATSNGRYPDNFRDEQARARDALRVLGVQCPRCHGTAFDETGTNHLWLRFKCLCTSPPVVVCRYNCLSTWRGPRR